MENYKKEKKNLSKIANYLKKLNINYEFEEYKTSQGEDVPIIHMCFEYKDYKFDLLIRNMIDWIVSKCYLLDLSKLSDEKLLNIFRMGLELNYLLPETTFSVYKNYFFVESDMPINGSFLDFKIELYSILAGLTCFLNLLPPEISEIKDTLGKLKL